MADNPNPHMTPLARPRVGSARRQTLMLTYLDSNMKPPEEILQGAIYNATQTCRTSLSDCIQFEELMKNEWAENRLADFNLWASGVGASVTGKASLDARLATRPDARDVVANLLQVLTGAIEECKALGERIIAQILKKQLLLTVDKSEDLLRLVTLVMTAIRAQIPKKILHGPFLPGQMTPSQIQTWRPD